MWRWVWAGVWCGVALSVQAESITEVLQRSQQMRLAQRGPADLRSDASQRVQASFQRLLALAAAQPAQPGPADLQPVELRLVGGEVFAEAVFGVAVVAVSEAVGDLPEGERLLLLAHELGHLRLGHWGALNGLYRRYIPGEVRPETTDPVAGVLGPQAHAMSHRQEFEADAFGFTLVRQLGFSVETASGLLLRHGMQADSATHPATRRRLAQLRLLDTQLGTAAQLAGTPSAVAELPARPAMRR